MLNTSLLDGPLAISPDVDAGDAALHRIAEAADRGDYLDAAERAAALLDKRIYDIRFIGYFYFGVLLQQGITYLPDMLARIHTLLDDDFAALGPSNKRERTIDAALQWLLQTVVDRCRYHAAQHDETWAEWLSQLYPGLASEIAEGLDRVAADMQRLVEEPRCLAALGRLRRWVMDDLPHARPSAPAREHDAAPEPDAARKATARMPRNPPALQPSLQPSLQSIVQIDAAASPAMQALLRKLHAFELLIDRGDVGKAAVVASDIKEIIESFDPLAYLPALFSTYFRLLHQTMSDLLPYWEESDSPAWQALQRFYQVDLDAFLAEG